MVQSELLLSVIIPAYNAESYLSNCIESILAQNIDKQLYEVIIVNDGSTDQTQIICEQYEKHYNNIRLYNISNHGQAYARNIGIKHAGGKYLEFVDSDDYIAHNVFGIIKNSLTEEVDLVYFNSKNVSIMDDYESSNSYVEAVTYDTGIKFFSEIDVNNGPWLYWVKREVLLKNNLMFIEGRLCEDGMFTCKLMSIVNRVIHLNMDVYRYVKHPYSTTTRTEDNHLRKMIDDFVFAVDYLNNLRLSMQTKTTDKKYLSKLDNRISSYIFFLQVRLLKFGDSNLANKCINGLKKKNLYPYIWIPYTGKWGEFKILYFIFNRKTFYLFAVKMRGCFKKLLK